MIVYGSTLSPFVRKVLVVAAEKGLAVESLPGGFGAGGEAFAEASPFGKIPALRDPGADGGRDFTLSDSTAIAVYLDAKHPEPALIPGDPMLRGRTLWYDEFADTMLFAAFRTIFFNRVVAPLMKREGDLAAADAAERDEVPPLLAHLERVIPDNGYLVGGTLTLADIAVVSPLVNLDHAGTVIDAARYPRTVAYRDAILARPSFAALVAKDRRVLGR